MATVTMTPPGFFSSVSGSAIDGVVMVLGVGRIDGDQRQRRASPRGCAMVAGLAASASASTSVGKDVRDVVRVDGDHRDRLLAGQRAEHLRCTSAARQAVAAGLRRLDLDEIAVLGAVADVRVDDQLRLAPLDRLDAERAVVEHARNTPSTASAALLEHLHDAAGIGRAGLGRRSGKIFASTRSPMPGAGPLAAARRADRRRRAARRFARSIRSAAPAARRRRRARRCRAR